MLVFETVKPTMSIRMANLPDYLKIPVGTIPSGDAQWLLGTTIPLTSDDAKQGETAGFEESKQEARGHEALEALTSGHGGLRNAPSSS